MKRYYMLNKPRGYISACSDKDKKTVLELFPKELGEGLFHIGRLDKDTEGLLIFTDDGKTCYDVLHPKNKIPKTYICYVNGEVDPKLLAKVAGGVNIYKNNDKLTAPAKLEILSKTVLKEIKPYLSPKDLAYAERCPDFPATLVKLTITEGKKHQVKRMMLYMGNRVLYLKRLSFANIELDENLGLGQYRELTEEEIDSLVNIKNN